jgi:hypothetical protein
MFNGIQEAGWWQSSLENMGRIQQDAFSIRTVVQLRPENWVRVAGERAEDNLSNLSEDNST